MIFLKNNILSQYHPDTHPEPQRQRSKTIFYCSDKCIDASACSPTNAAKKKLTDKENNTEEAAAVQGSPSPARERNLAPNPKANDLSASLGPTDVVDSFLDQIAEKHSQKVDVGNSDESNTAGASDLNDTMKSNNLGETMDLEAELNQRKNKLEWMELMGAVEDLQEGGLFEIEK